MPLLGDLKFPARGWRGGAGLVKAGLGCCSLCLSLKRTLWGGTVPAARSTALLLNRAAP